MDANIIVEARFEADGKILPLAFIWREERYPVSDLGRQWETEGEQHFLVMTPNRNVYELAFVKAESGWRLRRTPDHFGSRTSGHG
jgi:hypothetical protein